MQPDSFTPTTKPRYKRWLVLVLVILFVFIVGDIIYQILLSRTFQIAGTNPSTSSVSTVSPFFDINFTSPASNQNVNVTSSPQIIKSYTVNHKSLNIYLDIPLNSGQKYTITLGSISGLDGKTINNKTFTFKPKFVESQNIPSDQQNTLLQQQSNSQPSVSDVNFISFSDLINYGITTEQVSNLEQAFFQFKPTTKVVTINSSSITPAPHDPTSTSTTFSINFSVSVDSITYSATLEYSNLTTSQLILLDASSGATVYNSGPIGN